MNERNQVNNGQTMEPNEIKNREIKHQQNGSSREKKKKGLLSHTVLFCSALNVNEALLKRLMNVYSRQFINFDCSFIYFAIEMNEQKHKFAALLICGGNLLRLFVHWWLTLFICFSNEFSVSVCRAHTDSI